MTTPWVRKRMRRAQQQDAWRTGGVIVLGAILGLAGFLAIERWSASADAPVAAQQSEPHPPMQRRNALHSRAFSNCAQARAAGTAPVYAGQPGYGEHLDRDLDGVGCEPYRGR
jgi:hypothetical protein